MYHVLPTGLLHEDSYLFQVSDVLAVCFQQRLKPRVARSDWQVLGALRCNRHIGERPSGKNGQVVAKGLDSVGILLSRLQHIQAFPLCMGLRKRWSLETLRNAQLCEVVSYSYSEVACQAAITKVLDQDIRALGQIPDLSPLFSLASVSFFVLNVWQKSSPLSCACCSVNV